MSWVADRLVSWIEQAVIWCINLAIQSLGDLANAILGLLPGMPSFPTGLVPAQLATFFAWGGYWFPFAWFLTLVAAVVAIWIAWYVAAIPLRWVKVVRGNQ